MATPDLIVGREARVVPCFCLAPLPPTSPRPGEYRGERDEWVLGSKDQQPRDLQRYLSHRIGNSLQWFVLSFHGRNGAHNVTSRFSWPVGRLLVNLENPRILMHVANVESNLDVSCS